MRFFAALLISVALHGALAVCIAVYIDHAPRAVTVATLDLSSVELSFAEDEADAPAAVASQAAPPPSAENTPVPREEPAPETPSETPDSPAPPEPRRFEPPRPDAPREAMDTPPMAENASVAPRQAKVDAPPKPRRTIRPDYPMGARRRGEQGDVVLEIRVDETGTVVDVSVAGSCGFRELDEAAVLAAKDARFTPAKSGTRPVASTARLTLSFRLR